MNMDGFGLKWDPDSIKEPFSERFELDQRERKHAFGFIQIEATTAHFGRALALKNYWTYAEKK